MDNRFVTEQQEQRELFDRLSKRINTAIPGVVVDFDSSTQTCTVTPAIKARVNVDGVTEDVALPDLHNVPLVFPFAVTAGFALTLPVRPGDPCLLIFSQRCIDNWHQLGGVQPPETGCVGARHHDINDGFAILCAPPLPNVLGDWCSDGIEIRNVDRSVRFTLREGSIEVDGPVTFKAPVTFEDSVTAESTVDIQGGVTAESMVEIRGATTLRSTLTDMLGIELTGHKHGAVSSGTGVSGVPQ